MTVGTTRKGFTQAKFNEDAVNLIIGEIFILSIAIGFYYSDWYVFGGMLIGLMVCMFIPIVNILMALCLSILWALAGATIVLLFQGADVGIPNPYEFLDYLKWLFSKSETQVTGGILFLAGLGAHLGAIEWAKDVGSLEDRNI